MRGENIKVQRINTPHSNIDFYSDEVQETELLDMDMFYKNGKRKLDQDNFIDVSLITFIIISTSFITITSLA